MSHPANPVGERMSINPGTPPPVGWILSRRTLVIDDMAEVAEREYPSHAARYLERGLRSGVVVPLLRDGTVIGTIIMQLTRAPTVH